MISEFLFYPSHKAAEQQLRILELNSWQLLRLLQTHSTKFKCERLSCEHESSKSDGAERFCCSYLAATELHESWKSENSLRSSNGDNYQSIVMAYHDFLGTASKWLSSRSTDKPIGLLALGIAAMLLSCLVLMSLLFLLSQEINSKGSQSVSHTNDKTHNWHLEEKFILAVIFILILSMGSSSMVEEEQYIWHFMTSSFYLILLRKTIQSITNGSALTLTLGQKARILRSISCIIAVLVCGRILRRWHQGGVNWSHLPDISKLLEQAGTVLIKPLHLLSVVLVIIVCSAVLLAMRLRILLALFLLLIYSVPALIIMEQIWKCQDGAFTSSSIGSTTMIQIVYALLGTSTVGIVVALPWLMPLRDPKTSADALSLSGDALQESQLELLFGGLRDSIFVNGWCYVFSWSLLQMQLQQPVNSMPAFLLLVQILATVHYFSEGGIHLKHWVKVAALYYLGMAGHFGLGNTNTLATIDVAGAFMGMSSHSTVISGILMFIITYASPMLALLSTLMGVSVVDARALATRDVDFGHLLKTTLGYPCLVPLGLNSIFLLAYTIVLLLMRNHLFIWSVFSPKYLYVCATTACVYIGVSIVASTATYTCMVFGVRRTLKRPC